MGTRSITRDVGPLAFRAAITPASLDADKRTVQLTWTTGARVMRGFYDPYWEELSLDPRHVRMDRLRSGTAPLLNNHSSYSLDDVIGVVESAQLDPGSASGSAVVRFDRGAAGEEVFRKVADGIIRNVSVGYRVLKMVKVEGGDDQTPVYRAVDWEPYEISPVPMGADAGAVMRSANPTTNPCEFTEERAMPEPEITDKPTPAPSMAPTLIAAPTVPTAEQLRAAGDLVRSAERERVLGIQRVGRALNVPGADIDTAVSSGTTLEAFRATAVDTLASAPGAAGGPIQIDKRDPRIQPGEDKRDKWLRGAGAWIVQRSAQTDLVASHAKQLGKVVDLDPGEFRGLSLIDLARQALELSGISTAGMSRHDVVGRAFTVRSISGAQTTGDFPILLENALNKILLAQYAITADTWSRFCRRGSVPDFRASPRYRRGSFGVLDAVNQMGEFANKSIPDGEKQSLTASTKGNLIAISRQAIINDDMGAFSSMATDIGMSAALTIEAAVYALLALNAGLGPTMSDGLTLFHATHNNITTGAAIGSTAIDADRVAMGSQKDVSGNQILALAPAILLVPIGLGGVARQINNSQFDFDAGFTSGKPNPNVPNKVGGLFRDIIDTARMTGTRRYLFADPSIAPTIEVAFVDGQNQPFLDVKQGWDVDGVEWKVRLDFGTAAVDFRGAVTNAGA